MKYDKKEVAKKKEKLTSTSQKSKKKIAIKVLKYFLAVLLFLVVTGACAGLGLVKGLIDSAPDISTIDVSPKGLASTVYASDGTEVARLVTTGSNREYKTIDEIPDHLEKAFVAIEDERFYTHNGIDIQGIVRAAFVGITSGRFSEGASTITQQLLKNNVFSDWISESGFWDSLQRKIQEQFLAVQLEQIMDKDEILENYLNTINLGSNCLGVQTAAKRYFDKDVSELTISESAVIAAITQNPSAHNPVTNPESNGKRREKVLKNMLKHEFITQTEYDEALTDDVYSRISNINSNINPSSMYTYFVDEVIQQAIDALEEEKGYSENQAYNAVYSGGLSIYTTQDLEIQKICDEEMNNSDNYPAETNVKLSYRLTVTKSDGSTKDYSEQDLINYFSQKSSKYNLIYSSEEAAYKDIETFKSTIMEEGDTISKNAEVVSFIVQPQASVVVMDQYTGEVKAITGGRGEKAGSLTLNRATDTTNQPGSTFKVLSTFAPAIDTAGMTLATVYDDAPFSYVGGRPVNNYYEGYKGLHSIREAIRMSLNVITVKTITDITPQLAYDYLLKFGFTTLVDNLTLQDGTIASDINQPLALGGITKGITNLEITAAYATIANNGVYTKPIFITKILDSQGNVLINNTPQTSTVLKETTAFLLTDAMKDVLTSGTGTRSYFPGMPVAGKTGTTSDNFDIWMCGYTPYYTCSVWGGFDVNTTLTNTIFHHNIWRNIMQRIHSDLEYKEFTIPSSITTASVCYKCGNLAVEGLCDKDPRGNMIVTEYFTADTVPTESCTCHVKSTVCSESNKLAGEFCPEECKTETVFILRPEGSSETETDDTPYEMPKDLAESKCDIHTTAEPKPQDPSQTQPDNNPATPPSTTNPTTPDTPITPGTTPTPGTPPVTPSTPTTPTT